ncbi:hypothetical protein BH10PSE19_BH10PSE19_22090 [soil metagenome]
MNSNNPLPAYQFLELLKQLPFIKAIYLFGSRARGDQRDRSDIDLAIDSPEASVKNWLQVQDIIENADTLLKIDCVRLDKANNELKKTIYHEGKKLYERH